MRKYSYKEYLAHTIPCLVYGMICGTLVGTVIFFFKLIAEKLEHVSKEFYTEAKNAPLLIALIFIGLTMFACIMYWIQQKAPETKGGGIPRSEGILRGILSFRWLRTLFGTIVGSFISFFCGLPLGSEGPSVLVGTSLGHIISKTSRDGRAWDRYIMTGGAGAGFAVATGSPITAILFTLEEVHKRFTPMLILIASTSVLFSTFVNQFLCSIFHISPVLFDINGLVSDIRIRDTGYILLMALMVSLAVALFDTAVSSMGSLMRKAGKRIPSAAKLIFIFLLTGIIAIFFLDGLYSGRGIILGIVDGNRSLSYLFLLLLLRVAMMVFACSSGVTGGIFVPTLAIGALVGAVGGKLLMAIGMPAELYGTVVLLAMVAFMGGTMRAPLTAAVFFVESTAHFTNLFYVALVVFLVYFTTELFNRNAFYDTVLDDMAEVQNREKIRKIVRWEVVVSDNAFVIGKAVRDILWPHTAIVTSITRANKNVKTMDNGGEKKIYAGDTIVIKLQLFDEEEAKDCIYNLVGRDHEIRPLELV